MLLIFLQVSDLKGCNNEASKLQGIKAIPQNYLIGIDGKTGVINISEFFLSIKLVIMFKGKLFYFVLQYRGGSEVLVLTFFMHLICG